MTLKTLRFKVDPYSADRTTRLKISGLSAIIAILASSGLFLLVGANPIQAFSSMFTGAFGNWEYWSVGEFYQLSETLVKMIPVLLTTLAVLTAFRMRFWNIGADGQFAMGAVAATGIALFSKSWFPSLPDWFVLPLMFIAGMLAGALYASISAFLKLKFWVNEIISTLMLNYVAILLAEYLYFGPWQDPQGMGFPGTAQFELFARMPRLFGRVHPGLIFGLVVALLLWIWLDRTPQGFEVKMTGLNPQAARYAGVNLVRNTLLVMLVSGAIAGLAGMSEVSGLAYRLQQGVLAGYGNTAIIVAWLSRLRVGPAVIVSFLISALLVSGEQVQISLGLPAAIALVLQGLILFVFLIGDFFTRFRISRVQLTTKQEQM
ncbi:MAG TPA: ABC transporter permease [Anaerolineaceae bacterium]|nr:ABC transporter permease [Anaerolineaceae bacterium]